MFKLEPTRDGTVTLPVARTRHILINNEY